jgi:hypothetical protein
MDLVGYLTCLVDDSYRKDKTTANMVFMSSPRTFEILPLDIHYIILSYLVNKEKPSPTTTAVTTTTTTTTEEAEKEWKYPFLTLALVSKNTYSIIEAYTQHLLLSHHNRFPTNKLSSPPNLRACLKNRQNALSFRGVYIHLSGQHCRFCDKRTKCVGIVYSEIVCCRKCDRTVWPAKVTLTQASRTYGLSKEALEANCEFGSYRGPMNWTTMFMERDVKRYAESVYGDLDEWRKNRSKRRKR